MTRVPVLAIGRSGLLYDAVSAVAQSERYRIAAIITDGAYAEYDVDVDDFAALARQVGAEFLSTRMISESMISELVDEKGIKIAISANWRFVIPSEVLRLIPSGILNLHVGRLPDYKRKCDGELGHPRRRARDLRRRALHGRRARRRERPRPRGASADRVDLHRRRRRLGASSGSGPVSAALDSALADPDRFVARGSTGGLRCYPRLPQDGNIDWTQSAVQVCRLVRASSRPYPGAFSWHRGRQVTVWRASVADYADSFLAVPGQVLTFDRTSGTVDVACGSGVLRIEEIEVDGRSIAPAEVIRSVRASRALSPSPARDIKPRRSAQRQAHTA